jgi:hypothetical protein
MSDTSPAPPNRPTPEDLAGVTVYIEGEEKVFFDPTTEQPKQDPGPRPTIEDLAGITIRIEGEEEVFLPDPPASGDEEGQSA